MTGVRTKIQNVVLSVTYEDTEFKLDGAVYDPEIFPGLVYKSEHPRSLANLPITINFR